MGDRAGRHGGIRRCDKRPCWKGKKEPFVMLRSFSFIPKVMRGSESFPSWVHPTRFPLVSPTIPISMVPKEQLIWGGEVTLGPRIPTWVEGWGQSMPAPGSWGQKCSHGSGTARQVRNSWAGLSLSCEVLIAAPNGCPLCPFSLVPSDLQLLF